MAYREFQYEKTYAAPDVSDFLDDATRSVSSLFQSIATQSNQKKKNADQFNFDLSGAVLASDAFFPFDDCVKIAHAAGITSFIQPGGSIRDKDSIEYCKQNNLALVMTGMRHFKH